MSIRTNERLSQLFRLLDRGVADPDHLAREILPGIYEAMPRIAVLEIEETLKRYREGKLTRPPESEEPMPATKIRKTVNRKKLRKEIEQAQGGTEGTAATLTEDFPRLGDVAVNGKAKKTRKKGYVQLHLSDDLSPERHEDIHAAAYEYADTRNERMALMEPEREQRAKLHDLMKKHQLTKYKLPDGRMVEIVAVDEKVKVYTPKNDGTEFDG